MSRPTEILSNDHRVVLEKLNVLDRTINNIKSQDAKKILGDLKLFIQKEMEIHFTKEEDALFPEIEKFMPREGGPIGVMLMDHEDLYKYEDNLVRGIDLFIKNESNGEAIKLIKENGTNYINLLREHIYKEDNMLFMMADMHLEEDQIKEIMRKFEELDKKQLV
ncbi:MAG: hemerythrin domain-containing protein [Nitrospinae bacterium]|nr:hemerythrin domain-containing protein [Nitrospinota bacterium]